MSLNVKMTTPLHMNITERAEVLQLALAHLHEWGLSLSSSVPIRMADNDVRFHQYRRAACAMLGIADNQANHALQQVNELAHAIANAAGIAARRW